MQKAKLIKTALIWIGLISLYIFLNINPNPEPPKDIQPKSVYLEDFKNNQIKEVLLGEDWQVITRKDLSKYTLEGYLTENEYESLYDSDITITYPKKSIAQRISRWVSANWSSLLPFLVFIAVFIFFVGRGPLGTKQGSTLLSLSQIKSQKLETSTGVNFSDIGGLEDAKEDLKDVINYLKNPNLWKKSGVRPPRGVLLEGPPGSGKTMLAKALASETKASFFSVSGSEFVELFVGVGAARMRDIFQKAAAQAPAVIFIDEIDAVGRKRSGSTMPGAEEWDNTLIQFLTCLDGFNEKSNIVIIGATNRLQVLDSALLRAGRFDRIICLNISDADRLEILKVHLKNKNLAPDISLEILTKYLTDLNGAEIESFVNEASILSIRRSFNANSNSLSSTITNQDFLSAHEKTRSKKEVENSIEKVFGATAQNSNNGQGLKARIHLVTSEEVEGQIEWVDKDYIKLIKGEKNILILKNNVLKVTQS